MQRGKGRATWRAWSRVTAVGLAALIAAPATASAVTISKSGSTLLVTGGSGVDDVTLSTPSVGQLDVTTEFPAPTWGAGIICVADPILSAVRCPLAGVTSISVALAEGNDRGAITGTVAPATSFDLGDGDDKGFGGDSGATFLGGVGTDELFGGSAADTLDGGPGTDKLGGNGGGDTLRGGDGDDQLAGDGPIAALPAAADVIDGGAGIDAITGAFHNGFGGGVPELKFSLDGVANDGRPSEGDNVTAIETLDFAATGTFTGSDAAESFTLGAAGGSATIEARGGNDAVRAGEGNDIVDGGVGDDVLEGGRGNDAIAGGTGRDTIYGDLNATCTSIVCVPGATDDMISAIDGEIDTISCGFGTDSVTADAIDVVAPDCETVKRAIGQTPPLPGGFGNPNTALDQVTLPAKLSIKTLRGPGFKLKVACAGACSVTATLAADKKTGKKLGLTKAPRTVASGKGSRKSAGHASVTLKPVSKKVKSKLAGVKSATFTLKVKISVKGKPPVTQSAPLSFTK